jgi:adenylate cyclase
MFQPTQLTVRLLGKIEVVRGSERVTLPASRKARALLAYLAATGRAHQRSRLCTMLWDVPDDPRGALRSTLSKLRSAIDKPGRQLIVAEGDSIRLDCNRIEIDLVAARRLLSPDAAPPSADALVGAAASFRGEFGDGLTLSNCPDFDAWCTAEREEARRLHALLLKMLIDRHAGDPEAMLPHARELTRVDPDAIFSHATLLRVLITGGRHREAEEQRDLSLKLLAGIDRVAADELNLAWRSLVGGATAAATGRSAPLSEAAVSQEVATAAVTPSGEAKQTPATGALGPPVKPAILVLPFLNLSRDPDQEYFSDGITEDIITDLSQISAISVVSRNTAFAFKGKPVEIGEVTDKLKVGFVLEGSVRKAGNRIRITVQLVEVSTGNHLWAERFDRVFGDLFHLQDDISQSVVSALRLTLLPAELTAITTHPSSSTQAYRYYLEARAKLTVSWSNQEYLRFARHLFEEAVKLDPGYARAYAGIADCDAFLWVNGDLDVSFESMLANSAKALELAPNLAEAHASKGVALYVAGQAENATPALKRAIELDPELFEAHFFCGLSCRESGDFDEAAVHYERAAELQSRNHQPLIMLADVYFALGLPKQSMSAARRGLDRIAEVFGPDPEVAEVLGMGASALVTLDEYERAENWVRRATLLDPDSYSVRYNAACVYAVTGKQKTALESLEYAFSHMPRARAWLFRNAKHDAQLNSLRDQQGFRDLMHRLEAECPAH